MLSEIIAKIASSNVTVGSTVPTAFYGSTLRNWTPNAALPCRLLGIFSDTNSDIVNTYEIAENQANLVTWTFSDILLWKPTAQASGMAGVDEDLKDYHDAYFSMLKGVRFVQFNQPVAEITRASLKQGQIEFPAGSGQTYYGIKATLTVRELFT